MPMLANLLVLQLVAGGALPAVAPPSAYLALAPAAAARAQSVVVDLVANADVTIVGTEGADVRARAGSREVEVRKINDRFEISVGEDIDALTVEIPKQAEVSVRTRSGDVTVRGVAGQVFVGSTAGDITIAGKPRVVEVETVAGDVQVEHATERLEVRTVSGDVEVKSAHGKIVMKVTSGDVRVGDGRGTDVQIATMSGDIRYSGFFAGQSDHVLRTHQGDVELALDAKKPISLHAVTMSGEVQSKLATSDAPDSARVEIGSGGPKVQVQTMSGDVRVRSR